MILSGQMTNYYFNLNRTSTGAVMKTENNRIEKLLTEKKAESPDQVVQDLNKLELQVGCFADSEHGRQNKRLFCIACVLAILALWITFFLCFYFSNFAPNDNDNSSDKLAFE